MQTAPIVEDEQLIRALRTVGDTNRFKMFKLLALGEELCVTSIAHRLGISVSAVSQHFRYFELAKLVDKQRYGQKVCYKLKPDDSFVIALKRITEQ